jgi:hypothetical protein
MHPHIFPKVQATIEEVPNGKAPTKSVNPDEAVAFGAAVQSAGMVPSGVAGGGDACALVELEIALPS